MHKLAGLIFISIACFLWGFVLSNDLKARVNCLREIQHSAIVIKGELEYRAPSLEECFCGKCALFSRAYKYIFEEDFLPKEALKKACNEFVNLNKSDKSVILSFAENLYIEDTKGQIANISWLIDSLEEIIENAESEYRTKGKLYRSSGTLLGMGIFILLL